MGTIKTGILGGFNDTVGTVVGSNWKGISTMRARPKGRRSSFSSAQLEQKAKFALMNNFLQPAFYCEPGWTTFGDPNTPARSLLKDLKRPSIRFAAVRFFICPLRQTSLPRFQIKKPFNFVERPLLIFVNRIGFEPMTCCLEGSCSIQLSYRSGNDFSWNSRKNNAFPSSWESIASEACIHLPGILNHRKRAG